MDFWRIALLGLALSTDAVALTLAAGMSQQDGGTRLDMPAAFGLFQGLMPLLGFLVGGMFSSFLHRYANLFPRIILGGLGLKMLIEGYASRGKQRAPQRITLPVLLLAALSTSMDAFAVGIGFAAQEVPVLAASALIAVVTFFCCYAAQKAGQRLGVFLQEKAAMLGGLLLLFIALVGAF